MPTDPRLPMDHAQNFFPILQNPLEYEIRSRIYAQFGDFLNIERQRRASVDPHFRAAQRLARREVLLQAKMSIELLEKILAPILKLPDEVLVTIFWYATRDPNKVLTSVCVKWRFIALRTPSLWTRVRYGGNPRRLSFTPFCYHILRSGDEPIDVELFLAAAGSIAAFTEFPNELFYSPYKLIFVVSDRIRTLRICGSPGVEYTLFFPDRPMLSTLTKLTLDFENIDTQLASEEIFAPELRVLNLLHPGSLLRYLAFTDPLQSLHTLKIHSWHPERTKLLFYCPCLQRLIVDFISPDYAQDDVHNDGVEDVVIKPAYLSQLTNVFIDVTRYVQGSRLTEFFRSFSAPNVTKLWVNMTPDLMQRVISILPSRPESLTYLALNPLFTNSEGSANPWIYGACVALWETFPNLSRLKVYPYRRSKCPWAFTFSLLEKRYYWNSSFACPKLTKITFCNTQLSHNVIDLVETRMSAYFCGELAFPLKEIMFKNGCAVSDRLLPVFLLLERRYGQIKFTGLHNVRVCAEDALYMV